MRRIFLGLSRVIGIGLSPITRPLAQRLDARVEQLLNERLSEELEARLIPTLTAAVTATAQTVSRLDALIEQTNGSTLETNQTLSSLLDEVARLREQIESFQQFVPSPNGECDSDMHSGLAIVNHDEACEPFDDAERESVGERAKVG